MTRRNAAAAITTLALLSAIGFRKARAESGLELREIRVDVSPLRASAGEPTASWVEDELPRDLAQALAANLSPGDRMGAVLYARIDSIYLGPSGGGMGMSGSARDAIEGLLTMKGPHAGIAAETRLRATTSYSSGPDQASLVEAYHWRVIALAQAFAIWTPRQLGI
jgi:hypothetical protein